MTDARLDALLWDQLKALVNLHLVAGADANWQTNKPLFRAYRKATERKMLRWS